MNWSISWIFWGCLAYLFAIINLVRTATERTKGWQICMFCSLSFGVLALLEEYRIIDRWLSSGEVNAVTNSVTSLTDTLSVLTYIGILANLVVLIINLNNKKKTGEEE